MAYHSSNLSDPDVYHESDSCSTGQQIPPRNRVSRQGTLTAPASSALHKPF
jgi:hypothetical protein